MGTINYGIFANIGNAGIISSTVENRIRGCWDGEAYGFGDSGLIVAVAISLLVETALGELWVLFSLGLLGLLLGLKDKL